MFSHKCTLGDHRSALISMKDKFLPYDKFSTSFEYQKAFTLIFISSFLTKRYFDIGNYKEQPKIKKIISAKKVLKADFKDF